MAKVEPTSFLEQVALKLPDLDKVGNVTQLRRYSLLMLQAVIDTSTQ